MAFHNILGECIYRLQDVESLLATLMCDAEARATKLELASQVALDCEQKFDLAKEGLLEIQKMIKVPRNDDDEYSRPLDEEKKLLQVNYVPTFISLLDLRSGPMSVKVKGRQEVSRVVPSLDDRAEGHGCETRRNPKVDLALLARGQC